MANQSQVEARPAKVLAVTSLAAFMASLDLFIVNVAFDDIGRDFHGASLSDLSWVLNAYAIVYAALLVPFGRLADRFGRRAGFLVGVAVFTAASAACAASGSLWELVAFRVLQAAGAALLTPTSLGLVLASTPAAQRVKAVRIWAATGALAAAAGPVVGGLLVQASWRWVFIVNVPVGVLALVAGVRVIAESRDHTLTRLPDLAGALALTIAVGTLSLGLVKGSDWGWTAWSTVAAFVVAVAGTGVFCLRSLRHPLPVIEPALLRIGSFRWANVTALAFSVGFAAALLAQILWLRDVWHYSALRTGLAVAPGPIMVPIFAGVAQSVAHRTKAGRLGALGCALFAAGSVLILVTVGRTPQYVTEILPGWILGGIGVGLALPTILSAGTSELPPDRAATGSAVVNMSRQIGAVVGISVLVAVLGTPTSSYGDAHAAFQHGWWFCAAAMLLAVPAALGMTAKAAVPDTGADLARRRASS